MKEMEKTQPDVGTGLGWLGTILKYIKDYGVFNIIKAILLLLLFGMVLRFIIYPESLFEKYAEYAQEKHAEELLVRENFDKQIKNLLPVYLYKYHADRAWIIQYHNGTMDWRHGTMRFERCAEGVESIAVQYDDFPLTWLDLHYYLLENDLFIGNLADMQKIDPFMVSRLIKNNITYFACILIRDENNRPIAVLGFTWAQAPDISKYRHKIHDYLLNSRAEIKPLIQKI